MASFDHIFIDSGHESMRFSGTGRGKPNLPRRDRAAHSQRLLERFSEIWDAVETMRHDRESVSLPTKHGTYLEFRGASGHDLVTKSLENVTKGVRLLNIRQVGDVGVEETVATVFIPSGAEGFFINKIRDYATKNTIKGAPLNKPLIESIDDIRIAIVESMWTDPTRYLPGQNNAWCEVWLRITIEEKNEIGDFLLTLNDLGIPYKDNFIEFPERAVVLCFLNKDAMMELIERSDNIAEFRIGQETAGFWVNESNLNQIDWAQDFIERLQIKDSLVKVCVVDTGVNSGHPLLRPLLTDDDCLTINPEWGTYDHYAGSGHGTPMSGLAAFGQLESYLAGRDPIIMTHTLSSVKILPPSSQGETPVELWGDYTAQAANRAEIQSPDHKIVFCMAVTSNIDVDRGKPSSWSGRIDELSFGDEDHKRLFIISAGNIFEIEEWQRYPNSNLTSSIQNPAQSWNALCVGAFTEKIRTDDPSFSDHTPLAPSGSLSPYSSTSMIWDMSKWPVKPDVVFEGGNILVAPNGDLICHEDCELLSTSKNFAHTGHFKTINATSAATAQASHLAAKIMYRYPHAWPETIRAMIVHSAEWKQPMFDHFGFDINRKGNMRQLVRVFGYGVPNSEKAINTTNNYLTFVSQQHIQPFNDGKLNDMHLYELPWPQEELLAMGDVSVKLRITLSYYIEPGPGEIGWKDKYRYPSYALRFDLNSPVESKNDFAARVNKAAKEEGETYITDSGSERWLIGKTGRNNGSIHSDVWEGYASEIATCNLLAVYPVMGWWAQRKHLKKADSTARYSLVVSLETQATEVDFYTEVMSKIETPVATQIIVS